MKSDFLNMIQQHAREEKATQREFSQNLMADIHSGKIPFHDIGEIPLKYLDRTRIPGVRAENILTASKAYKPFRYEFGYKIWERQNQVHWLHHEVPLGQDLRDWNTTITKPEKNLLIHIFRLFTQSDVLVGNAYIHKYCPIFLPNELQMAFSAIANTESIHMASYSHLLTELSIPDVEYSAFMEYTEMADKYNFTAGFDMDTLLGIALALVLFGGLTEGVQLFASFAILFSFTPQNKMKGMGQIISFSVKDESLHVVFIARIFKIFMQEYGHLINYERLSARVDHAVRKVVENEDRFTDLAFEMGGVDSINPDDVKQYVRFIADMRLSQFGFDKVYNVKENPLEPWIGSMMAGIEHANFFEQRSSSYSRSATRGSWEDAYT